ncbi:UDP-Glycosyltransferase/glycogen phosphorylase [Gymnopus androsaceus JB14]|uniref:UDP-Glycosyltransferase/glycogen phosphorylase n=1 Tax=Gymnopus androsaceus JB14 TaxID=1447944 RepID=A0A6A4I8F9_9AGAR|nr:UDP-Glycosyltransferase/glycogen phosphorylase [Gymnopus androsaceus JB14]
MKQLESFAPAFRALYSSNPITCLTTGKTISGLPSPTLAIIDPFAAYAFEAIRTVAEKSVPILAWWTSNAGALLRLLGPVHLGGVADPALETAEGRAATKQKIYAEKQILKAVCQIVNVPGLAPCFDYEWFTQKTILIDLGIIVEKSGSIYVREADGIICVSANAYESEAVAAAKEWYASMNKEWYTVGPLSVQVFESKVVRATDGMNALVETFLNRIQAEFGNKSLIYISFGTIFWPEEEDRVWAVIDGLIAKRQPFLFSHPSPFKMQLPDNMIKKISDSGIAMELVWSPQEQILAHPVTGWFISHGGWNSMQEAFIYRVPLIFWPFHADQPYNAMRMSVLKAGFELLQVRTGKFGTRIPSQCKEIPAFTSASAKEEIEQLVDKLNGDEGSMVRTNFEAIADAMSKTWDSPYGESRVELERMLEKFL